MTGFEEFCGGPLWNETQFLAASWPKFTPCLVSVLPNFLPAVLVLLVGPCYAYVLSKKDLEQGFPLDRLYTVKLFSFTIMAILSVVVLLQDISYAMTGYDLAPVIFLSDAMQICTIVCIALLIHYKRKKGERSILGLVFWFFFIIGQIIPAYTMTNLKTYEDDPLEYILFFLIFSLAVLSLSLNFVSEGSDLSPSKKGYQSLDKPKCPELSASPASRLVFSWMFSLIRLGYKRDLQQTDVWTLPHSLSCDVHGAKYDKLRKEEMRQCAGKVRQPITHHEVKFENGKYVKSRKLSILGKKGTGYGTQSNSTLIDNDINTSPEFGETLPAQPSLFRILWRQYWDRFALFTLYGLARDVFLVCGPIILQAMLAHMDSDSSNPKWLGYGLCVLLFLSGQMNVFCYNHSKNHGYNAGMFIRTTLMSALVKKAMVIDNRTKRMSSIGDMVNLMAVDAQRIMDCIISISSNHTAPFQIALAVTVIYLQIGPSVFVGLLLLILLVPLNLCVASSLKNLMKENLSHKDSRVQALNEIFNGIKILKLYAWEDSFQSRIEAIRASEIGTLYRIGLLYAFFGVVWRLSGFLVTLLTFAMYTCNNPENHLEPGTAFMTLALFNILRTPLDLLATNIPLAAQSYISYQRINRFLQRGELKTDNVVHKPGFDDCIAFEDADLSWDVNGPPTLRDLNLFIPYGQLVAVVGPVGSGKSSLVHAILGDMDRVKGTVTQQGTIAYASQQAWIQNATVRDNILFGKAYRDRKYKTVLSACELERDMTLLTAGDKTEIGEKGTNLSGGQKQRLAIARAVYHDCDLYLLDDPLSAVDSHVGKAMFDHVIGPKGLLKKKTRIFVTHGIHFLPQVDQIVVMNNGEISDVGSYEQLLAHDGPFAQFLKMHLTQEELNGSEDDDPQIASIKDTIWERVEMLTSDPGTSADENHHLSRQRRRQTTSKSMSMSMSSRQDTLSQQIKRHEEGKLIVEEALETGQVAPHIYLQYLKAGGIAPLGFAFLNFWLFQGVNVGTSYWLSAWTQDPIFTTSTDSVSDIENANEYYLWMYGLFGFGQLITLVLYHYFFWTRVVVAGKNLHAKMTSCLLRAPMSFYDTTPVGRIINRCSRDIEIIDNMLPLILKDLMNTLGMNAISLLIIFIQTPIFGVVLVPVILIFIFVIRFYTPTTRQLRRIENVTRSQIFTHFSEAVTGASTIRAFKCSDRFIQESMARIDNNTSYFMAASNALRWLNINLDSLSNFVIFSAALFQFLQSDPDPGMAGVTISFALQISGSIPWMVNLIADFETNIVSVERIQEYSELPQEAEWTIPGKRPQPLWPEQGQMEFKDYSVRYREGLELVIKDLSITFESGQKIGVVGRTGAGKSSLSLSLFRLMEAAGGSIFIDGVKISDLGLHDLRSRLTILPQDPVIFSGSLRFNLDPFNEFSDDEIWMALERAHLKPFVCNATRLLVCQCGEEGSNLSVGIRQLVCLARSLLHKTKILILDEATAAVDIQTDTLIQKTIRLAFKDSTVIAIAHRLNTVMDYDKILVLDKGELKEFDTPDNLLDDPDSIFRSMAEDAKLI